ncbi:hypothetical protein DFS33DRAFT_1428574 [Desarmillaria ectypa]|nr:hypothetical protein DFS33DRAFT_1428574 [Desarmillaria ectypa]
MHKSTITKRSEASCLLDPSYCSLNHNYQPSFYVDYNGNMHDPDYLHFPVSSSSLSSNSSLSSRNVRRRWETGCSVTYDDDEGTDADRFDPFAIQARRCASSLTRVTPPCYSSSLVSEFDSPFEEEKKQRSSATKAIRSWIFPHKSIGEDSEEFTGQPELKEDSNEEEERLEKKRGKLKRSEMMKKQWYSISLSVSFGVFRAKRKMRNVLTC